MNFQSRFLQVAPLPIASLLVIVAAVALRPVCASTSQGETSAERYVLSQLEKGEAADLPKDMVSEDKRKLSAAFIVKLLTGGYEHVSIDPHGAPFVNRDWRLRPSGIWIQAAVITGDLDLRSRDIPFDVYLVDCIFEGAVDFTNSHFGKDFFLQDSTFKQPSYSLFNKRVFDVNFEGMRVDGDFNIVHSTFDVNATSFRRVQVGEFFRADDSGFFSQATLFDGMRVNRDFSCRDCTFSYSDRASVVRKQKEVRSAVHFQDAHVADFVLDDSTFDMITTINFTKLQADLISFDRVRSLTLTETILRQMSFKSLSPVEPKKLDFLLSHYDAEFSTNLENWYRTHGYSDQADNIFIAREQAERRKKCKSFWRDCDQGAWAWSYFQDKLAGYGKNLQNLLFWSLGFLVIGTLVFRSEKGMRIKDEKGALHYAGRYNAFWYSLDLFLPIIKLGEADVWTPKDDRRWANLYRKVHIIIGSLFVPIGLAALTGIIK